MIYKDLSPEQKKLIDQLINCIDWDQDYQNLIELIINGPNKDLHEAIRQGIEEGFKRSKLHLSATF
jgi:sulfur transfer protein SufE